MTILNMKNAYTGLWSSKNHDINIKYNEKVWTLAETVDSSSDVMFSIYDKHDGSSIMLRIEFLEDARDFLEGELEMALASSLKESDPGLKQKERGQVLIAKKHFNYVDYYFSNKIFGSQVVRHAYFVVTDYVLVVSSSWPVKTKLKADDRFPQKHAAFLKGIRI